MIMTEAAISKWRVLIKELDLDENETHLRLAIKGGGCSGFIKELDYCQTKDIGERDLIEEFKDMKVVFHRNNISILVTMSPKSLVTFMASGNILM